MVKFSTPQKYEFMFKSVLINVSATFLNVADVLICVVLAAFYSLFCVFLLIIWFFIYFSCKLVIFYSYMILTVVYACWLFLYVKIFFAAAMLFCRFRLLCVLSMLCFVTWNMSGCTFFSCLFWVKTACLLCFYACRCQAHVHACMVVFLRFVHAYSCMQ